MLSHVTSAACIGIDAYQVDIEVDIAQGLPHVTVVGLPDQSVKESKDRIKSAIKNSGFPFPARKKIVINLAPADIKKEGPLFDLPIALGILAASGHVRHDALDRFCILGELSLDGTLRPVKGALPVAIGIRGHGRSLLVPRANTEEASLEKSVLCYGVCSLREAAAFVNGDLAIEPALPVCPDATGTDYPYDFGDVRGQYAVKRALEIAVAGDHNMVMIGPPGAGKTMLAKRIPTIFPVLSCDEILEITRIHSAGGAVSQAGGIVRLRPFRAPHHTLSSVALAGGGPCPKPGEVSLAHRGVLFLDELPEFNRAVLEVLRAPLEDGTVTIARAKSVLTFPAQFMLVAAMNPCPCGYAGDPEKECHCSHGTIEKYMNKISGPLLDRIDLHLTVHRPAYRELVSPAAEERSAAIRERVNGARQIQAERFTHTPGVFTNAHMSANDLKTFCPLTPDAERTLARALQELHFSARAYHKVLKVARTIRDLAHVSFQLSAVSNQQHNFSPQADGCRLTTDSCLAACVASPLEVSDIAEALQYRTLDRLWE